VRKEAYAPLSSSLSIDLAGSREAWGAQRSHRRTCIVQNEQAFETFSDEHHILLNLKWVGFDS